MRAGPGPERRQPPSACVDVLGLLFFQKKDASYKCVAETGQTTVIQWRWVLFFSPRSYFPVIQCFRWKKVLRRRNTTVIMQSFHVSTLRFFVFRERPSHSGSWKNEGSPRPGGLFQKSSSTRASHYSGFYILHARTRPKSPPALEIYHETWSDLIHISRIVKEETCVFHCAHCTHISVVCISVLLILQSGCVYVYI